MTVPAPLVLPFTLRFDHIILEARVNGVPATLALDSGSGACAIDADSAARLHVAPGATAQALGVGTVSVPLATIDAIHLGDGGVVELRNEMAALVPLGDVSARSGRPLHGTIGYSFFMKYVVEIDYAACVIRLHDPAAFEYDGPGERVPIDLSSRLPVLQAELTARNGASLPARLLLDLGTGGYGSILTRPFAERNRDALAAGPSIERVLGTGVGGSLGGRVTVLDALRIGALRILHPVVAIPAEGRGFFGVSWADGTHGAPILRRTRLTLDYAHKQVIMEPVASLETRFPFDASGLRLVATGPELETVTIEGIAAESPGAGAGLAPGDVLVSLDGRMATGATLDAITDLLTRTGTTPTLRVRRDGRERDVSITLDPSGLH
jgi:hypothetical protein